MNLTYISITLLYFLLTHLVSKYIGSTRKIGYYKSVFWSIVLTPIIGLIIILASAKLHKN